LFIAALSASRESERNPPFGGRGGRDTLARIGNLKENQEIRIVPARAIKAQTRNPETSAVRGAGFRIAARAASGMTNDALRHT
jgi:hypothetical protein